MNTITEINSILIKEKLQIELLDGYTSISDIGEMFFLMCAMNSLFLYEKMRYPKPERITWMVLCQYNGQ